MDEVYANAENFIALIRQYTEVAELNAKILNEPIDRIIVREKTTSEDGSKNRRLAFITNLLGTFLQKQNLYTYACSKTRTILLYNIS